jgi:hypothetical protein
MKDKRCTTLWSVEPCGEVSPIRFTAKLGAPRQISDLLRWQPPVRTRLSCLIEFGAASLATKARVECQWRRFHTD